MSGATRPRSVTRDASAPADGPRTYYGKPVIAPPVWTWEVPAYVFTGGTAGAAAVLTALAAGTDRHDLARAAGRVAATTAAASPALLISDLGRPERFHHMLRVFKPTSPMSMGSWLLAVFGPAAVGSAVLRELGWLPRLQRLAEVTAAVLGPPMATYTAVLLADTSVPVWREARRELPFVFAGSSAAAAGAAGTLLGGDDSEPARRLALAGAALELAGDAAMTRRLDYLARPYHEGRTGALKRSAGACTAVGAALTLVSGRRRREPAVRRWARRLGGGLLLSGSALTRWSIFRAGRDSATDPTYLVRHQRERLSARDRR